MFSCKESPRSVHTLTSGTHMQASGSCIVPAFSATRGTDKLWEVHYWNMKMVM